MENNPGSYRFVIKYPTTQGISLTNVDEDIAIRRHVKTVVDKRRGQISKPLLPTSMERIVRDGWSHSRKTSNSIDPEEAVGDKPAAPVMALEA